MNTSDEQLHTRWEFFEGTNAPGSPEPIGLLYRRWDTRELVTEIIFAKPEYHRIHSRITFSGKRWATSHYVEDEQEPVTITAENLIEEVDAIPSYMEFLVLKDAIATLEDGKSGMDSEDTISYHVITPSDPHGIAQEASIWQPEPGVWEIETNGDLASTHWVRGGVVVRSDWRGVTSRPVSPDEALRALHGIINDDELNALRAYEPTF